MSLGSFRQRPVRRRWVLGLTTTALVAVLALVAGSASGVLNGFESNDGNMKVDGASLSDWANVNFISATDIAKDGTDDSFDTGGKQDTTCPDVIGHQNPPKDDFTNVAFYFTQSGSSDPFLYGATIRYAPNGTAAEVVEFNKGTNGFCPGSTQLLQRVAGDKLLAIDYTNGGASVVFNVLTWVTSGACFVGSHTAPCWGASVLSVGAAGGEGAASSVDIPASENPISNADIKAGQFAEFGINLKTAGIFGAQGCSSFASSTWGSRSSGSSFVASTKDITVIHRTISNCATVIIRKVTSDSNTSNVFSYSANVDRLDPVSTVSSFTLVGGANKTITNVKPGTYFTTEADPGPGYSLTGLSCAASDLSHGSTIDSTSLATRTATYTVKADDTIDCTFTNSPVKGAFIILKKSSKTGNNVLKAGAEFCYSASDDCSTTNVTDNGTGDSDSSTIGSVCVADVAVGTYKVNETKAPTGYGSSSDKNQSVTVVGGTNCSDNKPASGATATLNDPPLADIQVNVRDGGSGETSLDAPLSCTGDTSGTSDTTKASGWDNTLTISGVKVTSSSKPAITFTCTVKIDP